MWQFLQQLLTCFNFPAAPSDFHNVAEIFNPVSLILNSAFLAFFSCRYALASDRLRKDVPRLELPTVVFGGPSPNLESDARSWWVAADCKMLAARSPWSSCSAGGKSSWLTPFILRRYIGTSRPCPAHIISILHMNDLEKLKFTVSFCTPIAYGILQKWWHEPTWSTLGLVLIDK